MRFATITAALGLFVASVTALDKPLDIKVTSASDCAEKDQTKPGKHTKAAFNGDLS